MNDEEFKKRLSEVAEWRIPKISSTDVKIAKQKARGKGRPTKEQLYQEEHEQVFIDLFEGINPTYHPMIVSLKIQPSTCGNCGITCENGCEQQSKLYITRNIKHWRQRCITCERCRNPYTGAWDLTVMQAATVWNAWLATKSNHIGKRGHNHNWQDIKTK